MKIRSIALIAMALLLPLSVTACGDSDSGSGSGGGSKVTGLSADELSKKMQAGGMPKAQADCVAKAFEDSDFTEADLEAVSKGDSSSLDPAAMRSYTKSLVACIGDASPTTGG